MIRVMLDADLILEALLNRRLLELEIQSVLDRASTLQQGIEMHVTDLGLQKIKLVASRLQDRHVADTVIQWIRDRVQTFAVERSMLQRACLSPLKDFESAIELASANFLHLDAIVTHKPDDFTIDRSRFPVWSVDKLRERLSLESLLSPQTYNSLIRDLLKLQCTKNPDRTLICQQVESLEKLEIVEFLSRAIELELNELFIPDRTRLDRLGIQRSIDLGISQFVAGDLSQALESFKFAARLDPFNCRYLLGIARTNKQIGKYVESFILAIAVLSNTKEAIERSLAYSLVAGIYYELFWHTKEVDYGEEAVNFYTKAKAESPLDILPVWNTISTCIAIFKFANLSDINQRETYLQQSKNYLPVLEFVSKQPNSNWLKYKSKIIEDATSILHDLPTDYQKLIQEMQTWN
jgi:tetratricopeptide (TPR) repeat protein